MESSADLYSKGNEAFVAEDYALAADLYSKAIQAENNCADYFFNRSHAYLKLEKYKEAKEDADKAKELGFVNPKLDFRKGVACYQLGQYEEALAAFRESQKLDYSDNTLIDWISKCEAKLPPSTQDNLSNIPLSNLQLKETDPVPVIPRTRHEWYQTEPFVIVSLMLKNTNRDDVKIELSEKTLNCTVQLQDEKEYNLNLNLAHPIVPEQCSWKILSTKIEIKLKKYEGIQWTSLEAKPDTIQVKHFASDSSTKDIIHHYPSSSSKKKDWDKIVGDIKKEEADEKVQGEAAVNQLFQKIYAEGSEDVKRAMNKSFTESGGTVLSTNWTEVSSKRVEVKPPDGMEWKNWEN